MVNPSIFRNWASFDASLVPVQVMRAIQPCQWNGFTVHLMMTKPFTGELFLTSSAIPRVPFITIWELVTVDEELHGFLFQSAGQMVSSSSNHLLVQSPSLTRQFTVDDALAEGKVTRISSTPDLFNVYGYDIGATLIAQKALGLLNKILDKEAK